MFKTLFSLLHCSLIST